MTQINKILLHLTTHKKGITSMDAFERYGCTRLSAQIFSLRNDYGIDIVSTTEDGKNRYGDKCTYARYTLKDPTQESIFKTLETMKKRK